MVSQVLLPVRYQRQHHYELEGKGDPDPPVEHLSDDPKGSIDACFRQCDAGKGQGCGDHQWCIHDFRRPDRPGSFNSVVRFGPSGQFGLQAGPELVIVGSFAGLLSRDRGVRIFVLVHRSRIRRRWLRACIRNAISARRSGH